ncbi:exosome complex component RRP45-like [Corticium candelabrum]|uniref:exosome complex component RRP45-like n=1 Tax=Corticium candelabrum TaxID=121492 RepID=UPI002E2708F9|nr:exosome complex component RRP45-like [Corticium candelabrum]
MKVFSRCEREFILRAIREGQRLDGRKTYDYRDIKVQFGVERGHVEVHLGSTRVLAQVSCQTAKPQPNRPSEGQLFVNVELSPMASPSFEPGRLSEQTVEINRLLERVLRESRAVDTESLCIVAGKLVWTIRVDIHALDDCGDLIGCASIAAIIALVHFRRPDVSVSGEDVTIHSPDERNPVPLSVHHKPICVLFAFFDNGAYLLCDPGYKEEAVMDGHVVVAMNKHRELCCMQLGGGVALLPDQILRCTSIASVKVREIMDVMEAALLRDERVRRGETVCMETDDVELITKSKIDPVSIDTVDESVVVRPGVITDNGCDEKRVIVLGNGTAAIGQGGESQWDIEDDGDGDVCYETEEKEITERIAKKENAKKVISTVDAHHESVSEEEDVVMLTGEDISGRKAVVNEKTDGTIDLTFALKKKKDRQAKKAKRHKQKAGNLTSKK